MSHAPAEATTLLWGGWCGCRPPLARVRAHAAERPERPPPPPPPPGFLSENPVFAKAVESAGATWVGPPTFAIEKMGDKVESKKFAAAAMVGQGGLLGSAAALRAMPGPQG